MKSYSSEKYKREHAKAQMSATLLRDIQFLHDAYNAVLLNECTFITSYCHPTGMLPVSPNGTKMTITKLNVEIVPQGYRQTLKEEAIDVIRYEKDLIEEYILSSL